MAWSYGKSAIFGLRTRKSLTEVFGPMWLARVKPVFCSVAPNTHDAQLFGTAARYRWLSDYKTAFGDEGATRPPPMLLGY